MNKNRKIIFSARFHKEDTNSFSTEDGRYLDIMTFKDIRAFINSQNKKPKYITHWSLDNCFVVHASYTYSDHSDKYESEYARLLINEATRLEKENGKKARKERGYVHTYDGPLPLCDLWGKLPKQIILDNLEYLSSGVVWGYFGAIERMFKHDEWISELYDNADDVTKKKISDFLNHSAARHFMDGIGPDTSKEEFIFRLKEYMK